ncbi:amino acid kinase family protein [[Eubacterium] cellulosolvens]
MNQLKSTAVLKFGGSLIDLSGANIPLIVKRISKIKQTKDFGPIVVVSAPKGFTDRLQAIGEAKALGQDYRGRTYSLDFVFGSYLGLASDYVRKDLFKEFENELDKYKTDVQDAILKIEKRFEGSIKAKILASGGELPTSTLISYILRSNDIDSVYLKRSDWPIITDDKFESATPDILLSRRSIKNLISLLEDGKVVSVAGFLGVTHDNLETLLGRGGSDQTAVFLSCLLRDYFEVETILLKEKPVQSADPAIVQNQRLQRVHVMTYNEASRATVSGMKIIQNAAVRLAMSNNLSIKIVPLQDLGLEAIIQKEDPSPQIVKCVTGLKNCAIITMSSEKSRSLEDCLRLWEGYDDFIDLGIEVVGAGNVIRSFLILDADFIRRHENQLRSFDRAMSVEYGLGIVTLIGDKMSVSPGVASMAIGSIPHINIKRGIFAPHTSQIILVVAENDVQDAIKAIHSQLDRINKVK